MRRSGVPAVALAVLGGWLAIMPGSVLTVALRLRAFDGSGLPEAYTLTIASGWLVLIVGLVAFGQFGDALERRQRSRIVLVRAALPVLVVAGALLVLAATPPVLAVAWIVLQLPAAAIIASALALGGRSVAPTSGVVLSGLVGATSLVALLVGSLLVSAFATAPQWAFLAAALLGALLACRLALRPPAATVELGAGDHIPERRTTGSAMSRPAAWVLFTAASFLLSWATASTNAFIVLFVDSSTGGDDVAGVATGAVTAGALAAIVASILAGLLVRGLRSAALLWSCAAVVVAAALAAMLSIPTATGILLSALAFGAGFGLANGAELGLLLFVRHGTGHLGRDLGVFTAVTSVPSVLVPALGRVLLADDTADGLRLVFIGAAVLALLGALITVGLARTPRAAA